MVQFEFLAKPGSTPEQAKEQGKQAAIEVGRANAAKVADRIAQSGWPKNEADEGKESK